MARYVKTSGGSDAAGGSTFPTAWATLEHAAANVPAGDTLYLCKMGVGEKFTLAATAAFTVTPSTAATYVVGANSSGAIDGTIVEVDGGSFASATPFGQESIVIAPDYAIGSLDANFIFRNIRVTNSNGSAWRISHFDGSNTFSIVGDVSFINCHANDASGSGFYGPIGSSGSNNPFNVNFSNCSATSCSSGFKMEGVGINYYACWADNNVDGFISTSPTTVADHHNIANATYSHCIASNNSGTGFDQFRALINCVAYANARGCRTPRQYSSGGQHGIFPIVNCIFEGNTTVGIDNNSLTDRQPVAVISSAFYNNSSDYWSSGKVALTINAISLGASPFRDASSSDFRLNNLSNAGARCRNAAYPQGTLLDGTHINRKDIGAIPAQKPHMVIVRHR